LAPRMPPRLSAQGILPRTSALPPIDKRL
jgi:hypothetical protein